MKRNYFYAAVVWACLSVLSCSSSDSSSIPTTNLPTTAPTSDTYYGITRIDQDDWSTVAKDLGASVVQFLVTPSTSDDDILAGLDNAQAQDLKVLLNIYDVSNSTNGPWEIIGDSWSITDRGIEILALVENHSAMWAVYLLHEPFDSSRYYADAGAQRALYTFLKQYTALSLYIDIGSLWHPSTQGEILSDGMCDYCATFPTTFRGSWTSEECLTETFDNIDRDLLTQQTNMPDSQLVFLINTYTLGKGAEYRMPTGEELDEVRDYMCSLEIPQLYYPWTGIYDETLEDRPDLWPIIAEGCDE